jgi:hypothetical protein
VDDRRKDIAKSKRRKRENKENLGNRKTQKLTKCQITKKIKEPSNDVKGAGKV